MKKMIAIAVVFALVAGAAFAELTISGEIAAKAELLNGDNVKGDESKPLGTSGISYADPRIMMSYVDGAAGGKLSFQGVSTVAMHHAFVWWKPSDFLRLQFGTDKDGNFGTAQISGWGFTSQSKNVAAFGEYPGPIANNQGGLGFLRSTAFYPGISSNNLQASFLELVDGLTVNLIIPLNGENAAKTFMKTELNVKYVINDIGTVFVSFQGNSGYKKGGTDDTTWYGKAGVTDPANSPKAWLSFFTDKLVDNMAFDLGVAYKFPFTNDGTENKTVKTNHPVELGLGYRFTSGDFNIKVRTALTFAGSTVTEVTGADDEKAKDATVFGVGILPSYKIGTTTIFLQAGLGFNIIEDWKKAAYGTMHTKNESNVIVAWYINPYYHIPVGSHVRFQVGLQVWSDGVKSPWYKDGERQVDGAKINWAIPVGFYASW